MTDAHRKSPAETGGRFQPGNPGRRPGSRNQTTLMAEKLMNDDAESIVAAVIAAAKEGDMVACRLVLDRIAPVRKGRAVALDLPPIASAADVSAAMGSVIEAVSSGALTPDEGQGVAALLETQRKAIETVDIENRSASLERKKSK